MPQSTAGSALRYRAFISYSHRDGGWADWLHKALETYAIPKRLVGQTGSAGVIPKRLAPIFRDRDELASSSDLGRQVNAALAQSANLIVICSPHAAASRWVNEEIRAWQRLHGSERIFCLIVDGEPQAAATPCDDARECFAPALRFRLDAEGEPGSEPVEPIAADVRAGKDGKNNAKLKLIAGLLDVGFDQLRQRELQRRIRRMTAIAALAVAVMASTTVLAIAALVSRHAAVVASQAAERRQKQAEDLVGFMLGDLNDKLNKVHRLDIMQSVDDKAMAYFATLPTADVTDETLAQRVTALEKIGSVRMDQGRVPAALKSYRAASMLAENLVRRAPGDAGRRAAYGDSLKWTGQAYWYQGDFGQALRNFEAAATALQVAHAAKPADADISFKLAMAQLDTGRVLERRGDLAGANAQYQAELRIFEGLLAREPANTRWKSSLGYAWNNLGKIALKRGHLDQALAAYRTDQRIKAALAADDPANHQAQGNLLASNAILGGTLDLCGDTEAAIHYTRAAVDSARALLAFDPSNVGWREYLGLYSRNLGRQLRQLGRLGPAAVADDEGMRELATLAKKDPTNKDYPRELAEGALESARLKLQQHDADAAQALASSALATITRLRAGKAGNRTLSLLAAQADTELGRVADRRGDKAAARAYWEQARTSVAALAKAGSDPSLLAAWASATLRLNQPDAARPVVDKLAAMGYRETGFVALVASRRLPYPASPAVQRRMADAMK